MHLLLFCRNDLCLSILNIFQVNLHNLGRRAPVSDGFQTDPTEFNNTGMITSLSTNIHVDVDCICVFTIAYSHQYEYVGFQNCILMYM